MNLQKSFTISFATLLAYITVGSFCLYFNQSDYLVSLIYVMISFLPVFLGFRLVKNFGIKTKKGKLFFFLMLGSISWFLGEAIWFFYDYHLGIDPFPSVADFFFISGYLFFFRAMVCEIRGEKISLSKLPKNLKLNLVLFILFLSIATVLLFTKTATTVGIPIIEKLFHGIYATGDIILVLSSALILLIVREYQGGSYSKAWTLILFGFLSHFFADILFEMMESIYVGFIGLMIDSVWTLGYIFMAVGFYSFIFSISRLEKLMPEMLRK